MSVTKNKVPAIVVAIGSFLVARYLDASLLLPVSLICVSLLALNKLRMPAPLSVALAFTVGHAAWFAVGGVLVALLAGLDLASAVVQVGPDIVLMAGVAAWVYFRRSRASVYALIVLQIVAGLISVLKFGFADLAVPPLMFVHLGIRVVAIVAAFLFLSRLQRPCANGSAGALEFANQDQRRPG